MRPWRTRTPNVGRLTRERDLDGLAKAATFSDREIDDDGVERDAGTEVRVASIEALAQFFGPPVARAIGTALADPFRSVRLAAVRAVESGGLAELEPELLLGMAVWPDPPHGEAVAEAARVVASFGRDGQPERFAGILVEREDASLDERNHATLVRLLDEDPRGADATPVTAAVVLAVAADAAAPVTVRQRAREVFGWVREHGTEHLLHLLARPEPDLVLIELAGELGDNRALPHLAAAAGDPLAERRAVAATALGALLDTRAVPTLLRLTQDEAQEVRRAASYALNGLGAAGVVFGVAASANQLESGEGTNGQPKALEGTISEASGEGVAVSGVVVGPEGDGASARLLSALSKRQDASAPAIQGASEAELADIYALAVAHREAAEDEDGDYWNGCVEAVLTEAAGRPDFGEGFTPDRELKGRERRRQRQAVEAIRGAVGERA